MQVQMLDGLAARLKLCLLFFCQTPRTKEKAQQIALLGLVLFVHTRHAKYQLVTGKIARKRMVRLVIEVVLFLFHDAVAPQ